MLVLKLQRDDHPPELYRLAPELALLHAQELVERGLHTRHPIRVPLQSGDWSEPLPVWEYTRIRLIRMPPT